MTPRHVAVAVGLAIALALWALAMAATARPMADTPATSPDPMTYHEGN